MRAAPLEGGRARAGEGQLPRLRGGQPAAGPLAPDRPRPGRPQPAGPGAGGQVRAAPAADPAERDLRRRRGRARRLHAGRLGGCVGRRPDAAGAGGPCPRLRGRAPARRRHHRAGAGQGADQDRARVGLRPGRPAVRRARPAGGRVLLLARPPWRASRAAPGRVRRHPAGGRLRRVRPALRPEARAGADPRGRLLGARPQEAVRAGRGLEGADRGRGGAADRRAVRDRARDQRQAGRGAPGDPEGAGRAAGRRARGVAARPARAGLAQVGDRQGDRLRAQPVEGAHPVPGGWPDLPEQQRRRARAARRGRRSAELDLRRLGPRRRAGGGDLHPDRDRKLNGVDPQAWLADVLARLPDHPAKRIDELLPWSWSPRRADRRTPEGLDQRQRVEGQG